MLGTTRLTKVQRLVLGIIVLLVVDLIWVGSSELTEVIFTSKKKEIYRSHDWSFDYGMGCVG